MSWKNLEDASDGNRRMKAPLDGGQGPEETVAPHGMDGIKLL